jgi:DnaK suppressor protein
MDDNEARQLLAQERSRIEQAISSLEESEHEADTEESEPGELGSQELLQSELDSGLAGDLAEQLAAVGRAEARLAAGTYGLSVDSGEPIPDDRLRALPSAERTVEEQEALRR